MKKVNWNNVFDSYRGVEFMCEFVDNNMPLRRLRKLVPVNTPLRSEVYKLEKMGVMYECCAYRRL